MDFTLWETYSPLWSELGRTKETLLALSIKKLNIMHLIPAKIVILKKEQFQQYISVFLHDKRNAPINQKQICHVCKVFKNTEKVVIAQC